MSYRKPKWPGHNRYVRVRVLDKHSSRQGRLSEVTSALRPYDLNRRNTFSTIREMLLSY